jgi:tetratricopeptide (TPR) repeat protein
MVPVPAGPDMMSAMGNGPLIDPRLQEIESKLNAGRFDEAQRLLSTIGNLPNAETASAYFATRLLFQRGRMDQQGVIQRLRELLVRVPEFPEAARMLAAAEAGVLEPAPDVFRRVTGAPASEEPAAPVSVAPRVPSQRDIPRAPLVPRFTPRTGVPSYAPSTPLAPRYDEAPELPHITSVNNTMRGVGPIAPADARKERERMPTLNAPGGGVPLIPSLEIPAINSISTLPPPESAPPNAPSTIKAQEGPSGAYSLRGEAPSLFDIAAALDAGQAARALELSEQVSAENGPELGLLAARALLALGERARAAVQVERVLRSATLEPTVRATAARILLELGRIDAALEHARRALREDLSDSLAQLTCAWALTRSLRRRGQRALAAEAEALLSNVRMHEGPHAPLVVALRASLTAENKEYARALGLAQSALGQDPRQADAVAAMALAYAALGKSAEAERAQRRLRDLAPDEAIASEAAISRHTGATHPAEPRAKDHNAWGQAETALCHGDAAPALQELSRAAKDALQSLGRRRNAELWRVLASLAARSLTDLPVFRHFAPYDCSVFSVDRLEAALGLLFGSASAGARAPIDEATLQLLGAYVGESWRQAFGAEWQGVPAFPLSASIEGIGLSVRPCERLRERVERGVALAVETPHAMHPGADPLGNSVPLSLVPPAPWDPEAYPPIEDFAALGRSLRDSIIGLYCERSLGLPLDLSISGTVAIDRYVALLAPLKAPPDPDAGWSRRAAMLLGAYLGEVLIDAVGARWEPKTKLQALDEYRLLLPHGNIATPVVRVLERLAGRRVSPLSEYVARLASGRTSISA